MATKEGKKRKKPKVDTTLTTPTRSSQREPVSPSLQPYVQSLDAKDDLALAETKLQELRLQMQKKKTLKACARLINDLKLILIRFQLVPPFTGEKEVIEKQLHFARETLEQAILLSVRQKNFKNFERNFAQLKPYYTDYIQLLRPSERHWPLVGLHLLGLLAHNRIAEFHTELELIPAEDREKLYITYSMDLEQKMMEGSYSKVLNAPNRLPLPYYEYFTEILMTTVREKISDCTEKAYRNLPLEEAGGVFLLEKRGDLLDLAKKRNWQVRENLITFPRKTDTEISVPSHRLVRQNLEYASELERII